MARRKKQWSEKNLFSIELADSRLMLGQILAAELSVLNSVSCALYSQCWNDGDKIPSPQKDSLFSVLMITRDLLDSGIWKIIGSSEIPIIRSSYPYEGLRAGGFVGAKVIGSGIVAEFANAFFGLSPWDDWHDPQYLDKLLISPEKKPSNIIFKTK